MKICPFCESLSTIPIAYGAPTRKLERAALRGLVRISGRVARESDPTDCCLDCGRSWRSNATHTVGRAATEELMAEVEQIFRTYSFRIFAGMISGAIFSDGREQWDSIYAYLRLKEIFGITNGCKRSHIDAARRFRDSDPEKFRQLMDEIEQQVAVRTLTRKWPVGLGGGGLFGSTLSAAALVFNRSPMLFQLPNAESLAHFERDVLSGDWGFE